MISQFSASWYSGCGRQADNRDLWEEKQTMIRLQEINERNFRDILELHVTARQG